jgi:hypothetical protein
MFHTAVTVRRTVDRILRLGCESSRGSEGTRSMTRSCTGDFYSPPIRKVPLKRLPSSKRGPSVLVRSPWPSCCRGRGIHLVRSPYLASSGAVHPSSSSDGRRGRRGRPSSSGARGRRYIKIRIHSSVASKPLSYPCLSSQAFVLSLLVVASLCPILACRRLRPSSSGARSRRGTPPAGPSDAYA